MPRTITGCTLWVGELLGILEELLAGRNGELKGLEALGEEDESVVR